MHHPLCHQPQDEYEDNMSGSNYNYRYLPNYAVTEIVVGIMILVLIICVLLTWCYVYKLKKKSKTEMKKVKYEQIELTQNTLKPNANRDSLEFGDNIHDKETNHKNVGNLKYYKSDSDSEQP